MKSCLIKLVNRKLKLKLPHTHKNNLKNTNNTKYRQRCGAIKVSAVWWQVWMVGMKNGKFLSKNSLVVS